MHLHRMPPGLESKESKESEVPKARRASRRPDGRDETKAMNLQRFCDAQRETWPMGSRVVQTLRIKMLICHDPSVSILFQLLSFAKIANHRESIWCLDLHSILCPDPKRPHRNHPKSQHATVSLSLSLLWMNDFTHVFCLFLPVAREMCPRWNLQHFMQGRYTNDSVIPRTALRTPLTEHCKKFAKVESRAVGYLTAFSCVCRCWMPVGICVLSDRG